MSDALLAWVSAQVQSEMPDAGMAPQMRAINARYLEQAPGALAPISSRDIVQAEFTDYLRQCSEREQSLVIVQELLARVWDTWHVAVAVLGEHVSPSQHENLLLLHPALQMLGLENLLFDGLAPAILERLKQSLEPG